MPNSNTISHNLNKTFTEKHLETLRKLYFIASELMFDNGSAAPNLYTIMMENGVRDMNQVTTLTFGLLEELHLYKLAHLVINQQNHLLTRGVLAYFNPQTDRFNRACWAETLNSLFKQFHSNLRVELN